MPTGLSSDAADGTANQVSVQLDSSPKGTSQSQGLQDPDPVVAEDPESPRDIVQDNVLVLFPFALFFVFLLFGLVLIFAE